MATAMSGKEVFEMAIGMERIGKDFYEALALGCDNAQVRAFCVATARQEAEHLAAFRKMRDEWVKSAPSRAVSPEGDEALVSLAKGRIQPDPATVRKVAIGGKLKDALKMAMQMEQDAVSFYQELAARLPDSAKAIQLIVEEEKKHLIGLRSLAV